MSAYPDWLASTLASDATEGQGVLPMTILPLRAESRVVGRARVALMSQDDNFSVRAILDTFGETPPPAGTVLVAAGGNASRTATIGGLMALELQQAGIAGLVTDGLVRDSGEIRQLGFDVWCRGVTPTASKKHGPKVVGGTISLGGVVIRDDDLVIADADGVVIWPQEHITALLAKAEAKYQQDNARLARLRGSALTANVTTSAAVE